MEESTSIKPIAYSYGGFLALYSILVLVLIYVFNIAQDNWIVGSINFIITVIIFVMAIKAYKQKNGGFLSLKEAIKTGVAVGAVAGLITAIYAFIHYTFVYPEFSEMVYDQATIQMSEQGLSDAQQEQALQITSFTTSPLFFATMSLISSLFFGFIISLIAGAIMKQRRPYEA